MLIIRTPFRVSFFGGGTDFAPYYTRYAGCVLSAAINRYCYVSMRHLPPIAAYRNQFTYSQIERFDDPSAVRHPLVRAALGYLPVDRIQIAYDADLPSCSGVGSSSSFAVGLLQGLHAMRGEQVDTMTLAREAIYLEREVCREAGGVQDQMAAAFGGFRRYDFDASGFSSRVLSVPQDTLRMLQENLLLLFTGFTRFSGEVAKAQQSRIEETLPVLHEMKALVEEGEALLQCGRADDFGRLLHTAWQMKRTLSSEIATDAIDAIYSRALQNGALGGKVLGAGGGGFMLLYVPVERQASVQNALREFRCLPVRFEPHGSVILYRDDADRGDWQGGV